MSTTDYLGNPVTVSATVTDTTGTLVDPTTIVLSITDPAGAITTPTPVHDSTGLYHYTYTPTLSGHYTYTWTTTGPGAGKAFGYFDVISGQTPFSSVTFKNIIDESLTNLHGHTADLEEVTALSADITATATQFTVDDATQVSRGLIEIDSELMWVTKVDQSTNTVTIAPFGRGFRETGAASHTTGTMVMNNPRYPRQHVKQAIQQTLFSVYPDVFQVLVDESNTSSPVQVGYPVPANCDLILDIRWKNIGPSQTWVPVQRWKLDPNADQSVYPTGSSVDIFDGMVPGRTIKVSYVAAPGQFNNETDTLGIVGLADTARDILVYGACYRLLANLETARLQTFSIEQSERSQLVPPGSATQASKYFFALYQQALQRESARLQKFMPTRSHLVR